MVSQLASRQPKGLAGLRIQSARIGTHWAGYINHLNALERDAFVDCLGLIVRGSRLVLDAGWIAVDRDNLPLGGEPDAAVPPDYTGYQDMVTPDATTNIYRDGLPGAAAADVESVEVLRNMQRWSVATGLDSTETVAITANRAVADIPRGGGGDNRDCGHLFVIPVGGAWTDRQFDSTDGSVIPAAKKVSINELYGADAKPIQGESDVEFDAAVFTPGVTGTTYNYGGGDAQTIHAVAETVLVWCNKTDEVMFYPDATGSTTYTDFLSYATQCDLASSKATAAGGANFGVDPDFTSFKARSCETFGQRMVYFNTVEDGDNYSTRVRWSKIGNPLIVWPSFEVLASTGGAPINGVGAGWADLDEFRTEGLRIESLGDVLACYSNDGIATLRRTFVATSAFSAQYVTKEKGLVASRSMVSLGREHFAILTDGWYLLTEGSGLAEVGIIGDESSLSRAFKRQRDVNIIYKWKQTFYESLDQTRLHELCCGYDPIDNFVRISAPTTDGGTQIWIYDIQSDRVFLDDYDNVGGTNYAATAWGNLNPLTTPAEIWDGPAFGGGSWDAQTTSWDDSAAVYGEQQAAHGTANGWVFLHSTASTTRDGVEIPWEFSTAEHHLGLPFTYKTIDRMWVEYRRATSSAAGASINVASEQYSLGGSINLQLNNPGNMATDYADFRVPGSHHTFSMDGTGFIDIHSLKAQLIVEEDGGAPVNKPEGS
jgi:hypothetical protein